MKLDFFAALLLVGACIAPSIVHAQPTEEEHVDRSDAAARLIFEDAARAFGEGDYERALRGFRQAHELSGRPALLYNIGTALDRLRRDREALEVFERYLEQDPNASNRAEIEARVSQLRTAIGQQEAAAAATEAERQRIEAERQAAEEARARAEEEARLAEAEASRGVTPILFWSVAGAAVATGALGLAFGVRTRNLNDDYNELADDVLNLPPTTEVTPAQLSAVRNAHSDARTSQTLTNVFLGISGAAVAGAITLVFFTDWSGDDDEPATTAGARLRPQLGASTRGFDMGLTYDF